MYRSCPLYSYHPKQVPSISVWRHYDVLYVKTVKKNEKWHFLTMIILGIFDFHLVCDKSFWEWIVKQKTNKQTNKKTTEKTTTTTKISIALAAPSPCILIIEWLTYPEEGGWYFFSLKRAKRMRKKMFQNYFRVT